MAFCGGVICCSSYGGSPWRSAYVYKPDSEPFGWKKICVFTRIAKFSAKFGLNPTCQYSSPLAIATTPNVERLCAKHCRSRHFRGRFDVASQGITRILRQGQLPSMQILNKICWILCRRALALRYRVRVTGVEKLRSLEGSMLVMPNHPAYVDPVIVLAHVRLKQQLRPIVHEGAFRHPLFYPFMRLVRAFVVPEISTNRRQWRQQAIAMIDAVAAALNRGDSLLLYPSGRLTQTGMEVVGSARTASELLQRCPQAHIVLVRTTGLWGSMFGCARTGGSPGLTKSLLRAFGWLLASLVFFLPRRRVEIEIDVLDRSRLPGTDRHELNPLLEQWYNQRTSVEGNRAVAPTIVPHHFLG